MHATGANVPVKDQMHFLQLSILINAYISYMYEKNTTANIEALEDDKLRDTLLASMKVKRADSSDSDSESDNDDSDDGEDSYPVDGSALEQIRYTIYATRKNFVGWCQTMAKEWYHFMGTEKAQFMQYMVILSNLLLLLVFDYNTALMGNLENVKLYFWFQIVMNFFFLSEVITDFVRYGPYNAFQETIRVSIETTCQIVAFYVFIQFLNLDYRDQEGVIDLIALYKLINFIRVIKIVEILLEIQTLRVIYYTMSGLIEPMTLLLFMTVMIFYVYAVVGILLFGGKIYRGSTGGAAEIYYLVNMNDFFNAFFTLFCLMIVNNWPVFTGMFQEINGGSVYNRLYFYTFVYLANWMLMNLI